MAAAKELGKSFLGSLQRVKQSAEEKLGTAEKTAYDIELENLMARTDRIKHETEMILKEMAAYLQPNPTRRLENTVYKKLNRKAKERLSEPEVLAETMLNAAVSLGAETNYGRALAELAKAQKKIGELWATAQESIDEGLVAPFRVFLDSELKQSANERRLLGRLRLDLDAARTRARKTSEPDKLLTAEQDVQTAQAKYEHQLEVTKLLLRNVQRRNDEGIHRLLALANAQRAFYAGAGEVAAEVADTLRSIMNAGPETPTSAALAAMQPGMGVEPTHPPTIFVRVLCDYDAIDSSELSLVADEMISVYKDKTLPAGWVMAIRNGATGKVATSYLDIDPSF